MEFNGRNIVPVSPNRLFFNIVRNPHAYPKDYTYVILGKIGPTGKTWLTNELVNHGYRAVDLTESLYNLIEYHDDEHNYCVINHVQKFVAIVLNRTVK